MSLKLIGLSMVTVALSVGARADFSYAETRKGATEAATKHYLKGQRMKLETADTGTILDFDAQTVTLINNKARTYTVTNFSEMVLKPGSVEVKADIKETGQRKVIAGYNCKEIILNVEVDSAQGGRSGAKMQAEVSIWLSPDVPGSKELRAFYQRNATRFPWTALGGENTGMQKAMVDLQKKMMDMDGVPVLQTITMKPAGGSAPTITPAQQAQMAQARAQMEAMAKQGGPQAAAVQQALARMGTVSGGAGGALMQIETESTGFSTSSVADSVFSIPAGYQKVERK